MALDPIISLAVAIAEAPGSAACLLGAGVSVDAGVPTGWAIYEDGLARLYRLENETEDSPDQDTLNAWLAETDREDLGYSGLLDLIAPDPATRRSLLAGYFDGIEPGTTHERLAELAARGLIKVFITTNFDRLLERALAARGIDPVVVSDDATLAAAPRREHSPVYIVKAHGDYLQETLRNTPSELAVLEPQLTMEVRAIVDHYNLFVMGWSGADPAIADILRARRSRYGIWWLSLSDPPTEPGRSLAEAIGARVIIRPGGASDLLAELDRRLAVYETHESGNDPGAVHDETRGLLRRGDNVALDEFLRRERFEFEAAVDAVTADHINDGESEEVVRDGWSRLEAATQRRLGSLVPIALYRVDLLDQELRAHAAWATRYQLQGGGMTWQQAWVLPFWVIGMTLGGMLTRLERFDALGPIFKTTWTNHHDSAEPLIGHPGQLGVRVVEVVGPAPSPNHQWLWPFWSWLVDALPRWEWLVERHPDWLRRDGEPSTALSEFSFLLTIAEGLIVGNTGPAMWTLAPGSKPFAKRLHGDSRLRADVASVMGVDLARFDAEAPNFVRNAQGFGMFPDTQETGNILETGTFR